MYASTHTYYQEATALQGFLTYDDKQTHKRPAVLVAHDWSGRNEFACQKAQFFAEKGYVGFALDMFGEAKTGVSTEEKSSLIAPLLADQVLLRARMQAALDTVLALPIVDPKRIVVIGFCFGGLCALELARSGADVAGVVSFHGLLHSPGSLPSKPIHAKILALHGYDDPMVKPNVVEAFCDEMTIAKVDWQMHMYGLVQHAFTNPQAHDKQLGTVYNEKAAKRSWLALMNFLAEIF